MNAAMQNYVSIHEHQTKPNPALAVVHGQAALLLRYDVPTYYVYREITGQPENAPQSRITSPLPTIHKVT